MEQKISLLGLAANVFLGATKIGIGLLSRSTAILAEGIHSGMDVLSSIINYVGVKNSKKPADKEHPYGHHKVEVLSGFLITIILFLTGLWIIYEAICSFISPEVVEVTFLSVGIMILSTVINAVMSHIKIRYGKKYSSISLVTDGVHSKVDVLTSFAVIVGLFFSRYFIYTDSLIAVFIGVYIIKESLSLGKEATDSLLDTSAGEEIEDAISTVVKKKGITITGLKTQKRGPRISANIVIDLPKQLTVDKGAMITRQLEADLTGSIENLDYISIQIESQGISSNYYRPNFGKHIHWQKGNEGHGYGAEGYCICPNCDYRVKHERGKPCAHLICPNCHIELKREPKHA